MSLQLIYNHVWSLQSKIADLHFLRLKSVFRGSSTYLTWQNTTHGHNGRLQIHLPHEAAQEKLV